MKGALSIAAVGCAVGSVNGKLTKWSRDANARDWSPPQQTLGVMPSLVNNPPVFPAPTSPPKYTQKQLERRDSTDNTCGYVEGSTDIPLWCDTTAYCASNADNNHIGCCDDTATSCAVWTTCLDSTDRSLYTTDNGLTLWCGFTDYPNCITHIYADTTGPATAIAGYTLLGCAVAKGSDKVFYTPFAASSSSSARTTNTFIVPDTTLLPTNTRATVTVTPSPSTAPESSSSSSTNAGAIAGGVVGGVAALALIAFGIWFLVRKNNQAKAQGSPPPAPTPAPVSSTPGMGYPMAQNTPPPPPPSQQQQGYYAQPTGYDPRASMAKPQHVSMYSEATAPPSPQPVSPGQQFGTPSPPPPQAYGYGNGNGNGNGQAPGGYPMQSPQAGYGFQGQQQQQQQQQQFGGYQVQQGGYGYQNQNQNQQQGGYGGYGNGNQQQGGQGYTAELSAQRGDGEVRELQG